MENIGCLDSLVAHTTTANSSTNFHWLWIWLGVALAMILIPSFLLFIDKTIKLVWMHHKRFRDGAQIQDMRSWYSRIGLKNSLNHTQQRNSGWTVVLNKLGIKHVAVDYSTLFWPPEVSLPVPTEEGNDEVSAKKLSPGWPSRLRSRLRGNSRSTYRDAFHELEDGMPRYSLANVPDTNRDQTSREKKDARHLDLGYKGSTSVMSGALIVPSTSRKFSTMRRRHMSRIGMHISTADTVEINRLTAEELDMALLDQENERQSTDFRASSNNRNKSAAAQVGRLKSIATRRIISMPAKSTSPMLGFERPESTEQPLEPWEPPPSVLYPSRCSGNLHVSPKSEETIASNPSCCLTNTGRMKRSKSISTLDASKTCYDQHIVDSIDNGLMWLASPNPDDQFKSIGTKYSDTSGILRSPVIACTSDETSSSLFLDDSSAYEADNSRDGAVSVHESTTSVRNDMLHLSRYRKFWDDPPKSHTSSLSKSMPHLQSFRSLDKSKIGKSISRFASPKAKAPSANRIWTLRPVKRKQAVDRGIHVSMQNQSEEEREEVIVPQSIMYSIAADGSLLGYYMPVEQRTPKEQTNVHAPSHLLLSQAEMETLDLLSEPRNDFALVSNENTTRRHDLDDLLVQNPHSDLNKLQYELSPGFRSPTPPNWKLIDENVHTWPLGPHTLSRPSRRWYQRQNGRTLRRSTASLQDLAHEATFNSGELNSWRFKFNKLRRQPNREVLYLLGTKGIMEPFLRDKTGVDTAAWVLPQPHYDGGRQLATENMTCHRGFSRACTLTEWQQGSVPKNKKRSSSEAYLSNPPSKTLRGEMPILKVHFKKDSNGWRALSFVKNTTHLHSVVSSDNTDISGSRRSSVMAHL